MPPRLSTPVSTSSSSSDEPVYLDRPLSFAPAPFRKRDASFPKVMNPSNHESTSMTLVISDDDDDDEPEFVGPVLGGLAEKYRFKEVPNSVAAGKLSRPTKEVSPPSSKSSAKRKSDVSVRSDAISAPTIKTRGKSDNLSKQSGSHTLLYDLGLEPEPVPEWLGRTSVLLQLQACPICKVKWKRKESGIARWRHMSICRPPLYRPPNAPPNLQQLIHNALSARIEPSSLLELHTRSLANDIDFLTSKRDLSDKEPNMRNASKGRRPGNVAPVTGLTSVTNVHPSDNRGEGWEEEVRSRVRDWIGPSSPSALSDNENAFIQLSSSNENIWSTSPVRAQGDAYFPLTQPFAASNLAQAYPRSGSSISSPKSSNAPDLSKMSPNRSSPPAQREILVPASDSEEEDIKELEPGVPPEGSGNLQKLEAGGGTSSNGSKMQMSGANTGLIMPEDGGLEPGNTSSSSSIGSSTLKCKISSIFSRLSIILDDGTLLLDEQKTSLMPQKKDLQEKSMSCIPNPIKSHAMTPGELGSPTKDGECGECGFGTSQDDAILTWEGNSSIHDEILQEDEAHTASVSSLFTVGSSVQYSKSTNSEFSKLGWGEENDIGSIDEKALDDICVGGERLRDLCARGMPDYDSWDVKALQLLTADYGYKPIKDQLSLVQIAAECWKALNPIESEISHGSVPWAESISLGIDYSHPNKDDGNNGQKPYKSKTSEGEGLNKGKTSVTLIDLHGQFQEMVMNDHDLYLRILHYEPIAFDELVSKVIASGMTRRGWKKELKNYLDLQSVTYFTWHPTSPCRRP
ncbi:hypothetical protein C362_02165 [Cryptococcus neoformans Bt1]|nr:hypothetical protein C362_02165 [Cryptococcus neoformans var. grubii Bt1]OXG27788.1 hypothetical protein C367_02465 [Cryptococcus neoformans var. grubii Ze90-1]